MTVPSFLNLMISSLLLINSLPVHASKERAPTLLTLPTINVNLLVTDESSLNLYLFRTTFQETLYSHLSSSLPECLPPNSLQAISLDCELSRLQDSASTNDTLGMEAVCTGVTLVNDTIGLDTINMHISVYDSFIGENYWVLLQRFELDDLLKKIKSVDIYVESDLVDLKAISGGSAITSYNETPNWRLAVLATFSAFLVTIALGLIVFVWWSCGRNCCGAKTGCEEKGNDSVATVEEDAELGSDDEIDPREVPRKVLSPSQRLSEPVSNLSMIDEGEEEEASVRSNISLSINNGIGSILPHLVGHDKEGIPVIEYITVV